MSADVHTRLRRRRPQVLDIPTAKNADLALRIVLPGLPPLVITEESSHTLKMSQVIQRQQQQIIALMKEAQDAQTTVTTPPDKAVKIEDDDDDDSDLSAPKLNVPVTSSDTPTLASKRLKRDNVPTPLDIGLINDKLARPLIHLAPIRPAMSRVGVPPMRRRPLPQIRRVYRPFPNTHVTYQAYPQEYAVPYVAVPQWTPYPPLSAYPYPHPVAARRRHRPTPIPATPKHQAKSGKVTDVYHGDYTRAAPLLLQPLLAQREAFDQRLGLKLEEDRMPVLEDEVKEMQAKYDQGNVNKTNTSEIFGSISLMDELVYKFRIFRKSTPEQLESGLGGKKETSDAVGTSDDKVKNPSGAKDHELEADWLRLEKEKFLKICETLWDTFVDSRTKHAEK